MSKEHKILHECLKDADRDEDIILLFEEIKSKYPDNDELYEDILDILIDDLDITVKLFHWYFPEDDCEETIIHQFCYCFFDEISEEYFYFTISNNKVIFTKKEWEALELSDYLLNKGKEFNESTAKIYCKSDYPDKDIDNEDLNMVSSFSEINMYEYLRSELIHHT